LLRDAEFRCVQQVVFVGSQVADHQADPLAASYASAKHALRGLVHSVQQESISKDLRLFRPGYIDTGMLPKNAKPRIEGVELADSSRLAESFVDWSLDADGAPIFDAPA
jgi:NAD(P)-dependent dehydrogenase (short-subunit alcohol dehydrogenase family)